MNPLHYTPLDDAELDRLEDFLLSDQVSEDCLDLISSHGFLFAVTISPEPIEEKEWLEVLFDGEPQWNSPAEREEIVDLLRRLQMEVRDQLEGEDEVELPCELTTEPDEDGEDALLILWCQAFMEGVFLREESWFETAQGEAVAELMLPLMVSSQLFDEDEFKEIQRNKKLREQLASEVPSVLVDLYLLLHTPAK